MSTRRRFNRWPVCECYIVWTLTCSSMMTVYTPCVSTHRPGYRGQLALCSSPFEEGLFSSLYLFNKPETSSFGVRPASLIALIIDPGWALLRSKPISMAPGLRWGIRKGIVLRLDTQNQTKGILWHFWKIVSFDLSVTLSSVKTKIYS